MTRPCRQITCLLYSALLALLTATAAFGSSFNFNTDTFAFQNATVLKYKDGKPTLQRQLASDPNNQYTRRCFVMSRSAMQFHKFARFEPRSPRMDDKELAKRIRAVARHQPWAAPLQENRRIVFGGYRNLRELSKAHRDVFQKNLGSGFATYFRPSNSRMFFQRGRKYQETTHANLNATLDRGDLFVAYLSTYPKLSINHTVLIYGRKTGQSRNRLERYFVYDPNHADRPREMTWSP